MPYRYNPTVTKSLLRMIAALVPALLVLGLLSACADMVTTAPLPQHDPGMAPGTAAGTPAPSSAQAVSMSGASVSYTLKTTSRDGGLTFVGVGGAIDEVANPLLSARPGDLVVITLVNGEPSEHDLTFDGLKVQSPRVRGLGAQTEVEFTAPAQGEFAYYCTLAGHRMAGMEGKFVVGDTAQAAGTPPRTGADIVRAPGDLPPTLPNRAPQLVRVSLEAIEVEGQLAGGATYPYWTFNGKVPGPFLRVRVGDTVEVSLKNSGTSRMTHSIDLHAATGPGGGAAVMQVPPGAEKRFTFKALHPGLYVYHCASPMVAMHIANGMYGMILVEPEGGLPPVDREFYVMQGEIYTQQPFGSEGLLAPSEEKLLAETPEYFVFNGAVGALSKEQQPLRARAGETVRIYFGVGGPNFVSSFHAIGEVFDRVYNQASLTSPRLTGVQTTLVPTGGATVVDLHLEVPGTYMLMDHSLSRAERGLSGMLIVEGDPRPDLFHEGPASPEEGAGQP